MLKTFDYTIVIKCKVCVLDLYNSNLKYTSPNNYRNTYLARYIM